VGPVPVTIWVDPGCPWAWQTARWLVDLESRGVVTLAWRLFSLELNASEPDTPPIDAFPRQRGSITSLLLARRERGDAGFRDLYLEIGRRHHDARAEMTVDLLRKAAADAGIEGIHDRAANEPDLLAEVVAEYERARSLDVFGVPTIKLGDSKATHGPIMSIAPGAEDALDMWEHVRWLVSRPEVFELKRWPRDLKPGHAPPNDRDA
jgi:hypothetical protein